MVITHREPQSKGSRNPVYREESKLFQRHRRLADRCVRWIIAVGGFAIIAVILTILFFIGIEVYPLFRPAKVTEAWRYPVGEILFPPGEEGEPVAVGVEENREVGYILTDRGTIRFFSTADGKPRERYLLEGTGGERIVSVRQSLDGKRLVAGTDRGMAIPIDIEFHPSYFEGDRSYRPEIREGKPLELDPERRPLDRLAFAGEPGGAFVIVALTGDSRVVLLQQLVEEALFGGLKTTRDRYELELPGNDDPLSLAIDDPGGNLYVGTAGGQIHRWTLSGDGPPEWVGTLRVPGAKGAGITKLVILIGDRTLVAGGGEGRVGAYCLVRDSTAISGRRLVRIHEMGPHPAAVTILVPSPRRKGFISGDSEGGFRLQYTTSERVLAEFKLEAGGPVRFVQYTQKGDGALVLDSAGHVGMWDIDNPHPEAGFRAFFGRVWYEGYDRPEHVWQSTGGTDEFESKLSLVPLIFGSLKGTFYALILAVPLAILAALYTSQFMHPAFRNYVKPAVEIMAALPSVVLGFLAGLWLAPIIEKVIPGVLLLAVVIPLMILAASRVWRGLPHRIRDRFRHGIEAWISIPLLVLGVWICLTYNGSIESLLFDGSFSQWLYDTLQVRYDQRNALVVGFAMGFAVVPIIYTISEDALSNVPRHLISGSLALGATRWQTAVRVVLPTAAAGIFSAVMIGFGRAVGETMIVLMATGNTPIMDWNLFNGFRTLSANIAVEIPEAPVNGTLYRVLFLAALLLFVVTFMVNTGAEIVRQKVRKRYQKL